MNRPDAPRGVSLDPLPPTIIAGRQNSRRVLDRAFQEPREGNGEGIVP